MNATFYYAFEQKFRGSRESIKSRCEVYLPFIKPLREYFPQAKAVDLGCGRGEWLELLQEHGFDAQGVDINDAMLAGCRERGLEAHAGDALDFLGKLPDASQLVVSGLHIAEHIPFSELQELVSQAWRVLVAGGILILETPNPENLVVGSSSFYLDPTHQRPIPPELLAFMTEYAGFRRTKILRLQESRALANSLEPKLLDVLTGVSPDYAVIAQKEGSARLLEATGARFAADYGLRLETLASRYQQQLDARAADEVARASQAEERLAQAEARELDSRHQVQQLLVTVRQAQTLTERADARAADEAERARQAEQQLKLAEIREVEAHAQLRQLRDALRDSGNRVAESEHRVCEQQQRVAELTRQLETMTRQAHDWHDQILRLQRTVSWRITGPVRWFRRAMIAGYHGTRWLISRLVLAVLLVLCLPLAPFLLLSARFVLARPNLRNRIGQHIRRYPTLRAGLRLLAFRLGFLHHDPRLATAPDGSESPRHAGATGNPARQAPLSPRARQIHADLKLALQQGKQENA